MSELLVFKPPNYCAYLVRLWRESPQTPWRASAQCASSGEKVMFVNLDDLFMFLLAQTTEQQRPEEEITGQAPSL